jgi:hypothetical protein
MYNGSTCEITQFTKCFHCRAGTVGGLWQYVSLRQEGLCHGVMEESY